ncbi:hypothetical protein SAMN04487887_102252 [Enterococcus casseliflavus]|uniref:hypothetical protein n=1 Tax=Enterococcus casseliflavus TaxID=37734 RepID=UPI0008F18A2A|nr:hypothetical protein [Enterococcus casseliflavus]SFD57590.1 hypothetical protein SAMN04487887_102252 [Enterococcus casseliflavus]
MANRSKRSEHSRFLVNFLARHFANHYSKLTNDEKETIGRIENTISKMYVMDTSPKKVMFRELLDTMEEMNDMTCSEKAYTCSIDCLINIWDEICNINSEVEENDE